MFIFLYDAFILVHPFAYYTHNIVHKWCCEYRHNCGQRAVNQLDITALNNVAIRRKL